MPFVHLQLGKQNRVIQSGGYLTDTAADAVYHLTVQIGTGHIITVFFRKWRYRFVGRKAFTRINRGTVDQLAAIRHIGASV